MKKILMLTAGFGDGHNAAARNLRDALELISDDVKVEVLDLFDSGKSRLRDVQFDFSHGQFAFPLLQINGGVRASPLSAREPHQV